MDKKTYSNCKYYSSEHGRKNGRDCLLNPDEPRRCKMLLYEKECDKYKEKKNDN